MDILSECFILNAFVLTLSAFLPTSPYFNLMMHNLLFNASIITLCLILELGLFTCYRDSYLQVVYLIFRGDIDEISTKNDPSIYSF